MKALFDWTVRGLLLALAVAWLVNTVGCAGSVYTKTDDGAVKTTSVLDFTMGDASTQSVEGGQISLPGATLIGGVFKGLAEMTASLLGNAPIVINHVEKAPAD